MIPRPLLSFIGLAAFAALALLRPLTLAGIALGIALGAAASLAVVGRI